MGNWGEFPASARGWRQLTDMGYIKGNRKTREAGGTDRYVERLSFSQLSTGGKKGSKEKCSLFEMIAGGDRGFWGHRNGKAQKRGGKDEKSEE